MSCHVMSWHVMSCRVVSCRVVSCRATMHGLSLSRWWAVDIYFLKSQQRKLCCIFITWLQQIYARLQWMTNLSHFASKHAIVSPNCCYSAKSGPKQERIHQMSAPLLNRIVICMQAKQTLTKSSACRQRLFCWSALHAGKKPFVEVTCMQAKNILIATGGRAQVPPIEGKEHTMISDQILDLPKKPERWAWLSV